MNILNQFITEYGVTLMNAIFTAIAGYVGIAVKRMYDKYIIDQTKKSVVKTAVKAIEQLYHNLKGAEKLSKAKVAVIEMLQQKNIIITDLELTMLIESAVSEFNHSVKGGADNE